MLKWDEFEEESRPLRLPHLLYWVIAAVYTAAFVLVLFGWMRWLGLVLNYNQTIFSLLR
ncbi:MAG: hypothetical protein KGZ79_07305 [Dethiobacter sp.]|nr:hypothetical protein [Dethiobacter sp.]